jgi:hypothetical protein
MRYMPVQKSSILIISIIIFSCTVDNSFANAGMSQARSLGMGGAYTCLAIGADAPQWNPANLSLKVKNKIFINMFAVAAFFKNNSFSKNDYDRYNDASLTRQDKERIFSLVPKSGCTFNAGGRAQALSFAYGPVAFSSTIIVSGKTRFPKELIDLVLFGNERARRYNFQPVDGDAISYGSFALSGGYPLKTGLSWLAQEGVGATVKYLRGFQCGEVLKANATTLAEFQGTEFHGSALMRRATVGHGFGLDVGVVGTIALKYRFGLVLENVPAIIYWSGGAEEIFVQYQADSMTVERLQDVDIDSIISQQDSVYAIHAFSKRLPTILRLGVARKMGDFILAMDYEQGFRNTSISEVTPLFAFGAEWRRWRFMRLRSGLTLGGHAGFAISWGVGLTSGPVFFDLAIRTYNSPLLPWARGIAVGTSLRLYL